jgi:hypothetical protein
MAPAKNSLLHCPLCGLTRSFCALSAGEWGKARQFNPMGPWVYAACWGLGVLGLVSLGRRVVGRRKQGSRWFASVVEKQHFLL